MPDLIRPLQTGNFWLGLGAAVALTVAGPAIGKVAKPIAVKGVQGALFLTDKTGELLTTGRTQLNNMMENAKKSAENFVQDSSDSIGQLVNELQESNRKANMEISRLETEIQELRNQLQGFQG